MIYRICHNTAPDCKFSYGAIIITTDAEMNALSLCKTCNSCVDIWYQNVLRKSRESAIEQNNLDEKNIISVYMHSRNYIHTHIEQFHTIKYT